MASYQSINYIFLSAGRIHGVYITCLCQKISKCLTSALNVATTVFIAQIYINVVGAKMKQKVENEEWNYGDIDSDEEDEFIIQRLLYTQKQSSKRIL